MISEELARSEIHFWMSALKGALYLDKNKKHDTYEMYYLLYNNA